MNLKLEKNDLDEYLGSSDVIDYYHPSIIALAELLCTGVEDEMQLARRAYEYVRDQIAHSGDINADAVTCNASDVLINKHGICCAKSHLLSAILRYLRIPSGFCYQLLLSDNEDGHLLVHGLNAIYLKSINKWMRLGARGNKQGVNAQLSINSEKLAWPVRTHLGELDEQIVYAWPKEEIVKSLRLSKNRKELSDKWINIVIPATCSSMRNFE